MSNDSLDTKASVTGPADAERRSALLAMAKGLVYVPPVVATFAMGGLSARAAAAYVTNLPV
ncbi:MAG: hypothetical protein P4M07_09265 [Xanthobacteraceae bacterium]|nr:hypothetical protein [Xanthobacteraceae bacterium]